MLNRPTRVRHLVLAMTIAVYMITYMDRVVISNAAPVIRKDLGFSLVTMGWILASFRWSYALFQIPGGWLGDRIGPRRALALIVTWWSLFTSATALAWSAASMIAIRFLFGIGEAGAFPIATRSLSRWLLPGERGFAQGITHAGSRLGAALTPPLVVFLIARFGWHAAFYAFGALGIAWSAQWFGWYRDTPAEHKGVNAGERELIQSAAAPRRAGALAQDPGQPRAVEFERDVLLLQLRPGHLSRLVPDLSARISPVYARADGILRHAAAAGGHSRRPGRRLAFRYSVAAHGPDQFLAAQRGDRRIFNRRFLHSGGGAHQQSATVGDLQLLRVFRDRGHRRRFLGDPAGCGRRLRRIGFLGHEYVR